MAFKKSTEVHRLSVPKTGEILHFDEGKPSERVAGLALRIRAGGSRKYVFFYRLGGRQLKYTIGDATAWTLDEARAEARRLRVKVDRGENPGAEKTERTEANRLILSSVVDDYLAVKARVMRPRSLEETRRHLQKHWAPLHGLPISGVTRAMVASRLSALGDDKGPVTADHARSNLSAMFAWAIGQGLCDANPVVGTNKQNEGKPRDRVLSDAELVAIWKAAPDSDYGRILKLLMLTGQRRQEIGGLRWSEIDTAAKLIALPGDRTKNGRAHDVPLSDLALDMLAKQHRRIGRGLVFGEGEGGFNGWAKSKRAFDAATGLNESWTLHDLRRTAATRMADLGVQPHIIEAVLNHVSGHKAGVAGIYNRSTYAAEKRAALDLLASHLKVELAKAEGANVRRLKAR
jgi:integrase